MTVFYYDAPEVVEPAANENLPGYRPSLLDRSRACQGENAARVLVVLTAAFALAEVVFAVLQTGVGQ